VQPRILKQSLQMTSALSLLGSKKGKIPNSAQLQGTATGIFSVSLIQLQLGINITEVK